MSIGSNTLNTALSRGRDNFMRQLADMWKWIRDLEKKQEVAQDEKAVNTNERKDEV